MALSDDREAVSLEALGEPHLPERLGSVELLGEDPRREDPQLLLRAGRRQRSLAHVVVEIEVGVVDPDRPALAEGDEAQLLAEAGDEVEAGADVLAELVLAGRRSLEDRGRGDVHVGAVSLHVQERAIEPGKPVLTHSGIFAHSPAACPASADSALERRLHGTVQVRRPCDACHTGSPTRPYLACSNGHTYADLPSRPAPARGEQGTHAATSWRQGRIGRDPPLARSGIDAVPPASPTANSAGRRESESSTMRRIRRRRRGAAALASMPVALLATRNGITIAAPPRAHRPALRLAADGPRRGEVSPRRKTSRDRRPGRARSSFPPERPAPPAWKLLDTVHTDPRGTTATGPAPTAAASPRGPRAGACVAARGRQGPLGRGPAPRQAQRGARKRRPPRGAGPAGRPPSGEGRGARPGGRRRA